MHSKRTSTNSSKKKTRKGESTNNGQHLDDNLHGKVLTLTVGSKTNRSSSSSYSNNKTSNTTNTEETFDQQQVTDTMQIDDNMLPTKSEVWNYATKLPNGKAKCKSCNREIACKDHSTTGLRRHLDRCMKTSKFLSNNSTIFKKSINIQMKKRLDELAYQTIIEDGRTFDDLRKPGISRLLQEIVPGYKAPTRRTVQRQLKRLHNNHEQILLTELKYIDALAVTTDLWSDKKVNSYMCLTGHYINSDSKLTSKVLSFTIFPERHTGEHISYTIKKQLKRLQVYEKTNVITCDGASNMKKSFNTLKPKRLQCLGHKLHLVVCNALCLWVKDQQLSESSTTGEENNESFHDVNTNNTNDSHNFDNAYSTVDDETSNDGPDIMDDEDSSTDKDSDVPDNSSETSDLINENWEEDVSEDILSITCVQQLLKFELNRDEWEILEHVNEVLESFSEATKLISGKKYSTIGLGLFSITSLKEKLEERSGKYEIDELKDLLLNQLINYFENDSDQYELLKRYAFYDPLGFGVLDRVDRTKIEREIKKLHSEYMASSTSPNSFVFGFATTAKSKPKSNLLQGFLSSLGKRRPGIIKEGTNLSLTDELSIYRSLAMQEFNDIIADSKEYDPFAFWNLHSQKLKFLSILARKHLIVPSTSVPSESTFSIASYLGRKERNRLTPENLCRLVFLKDKVTKKM
ncbi:unnamed protein product [Rotaria sordida]|uniref:BED-type domain-containing protein n=1 Tax=Rotaria sordida TaxID=392033 RepID=A0A818T9B9_9BILA|nr:unnamed protein product [Rotaria sordida]